MIIFQISTSGEKVKGGLTTAKARPMKTIDPMAFIYEPVGIFWSTFSIADTFSMAAETETLSVTDAFPVERCHAGIVSFNGEQ